MKSSIRKEGNRIPILKKIPGNHNIGETPVPIPNTEVKPFSADGTARGAEWESRSLPGFFICLAMVDDRGFSSLAMICMRPSSYNSVKDSFPL
jgi:hypothetical protein